MNNVLNLVLAVSALSLTACGFVGEDKAQMEQAWLAQDQQLKTVVEQIRAQGIATVAQGAAAGSVAQCVASQLSKDPLGQLVSVEGALVEQAKIAELMTQLQAAMEQEVSFSQLFDLLLQGADLAAYASALVDQQGLEQALQTVEQLARSGGEFATQDLGVHFQQLLQECQQG